MIERVSTEALIAELKRRNDGTYLEDVGPGLLKSRRGRNNHSKAVELLMNMNVGEVKRLFHKDVQCHGRPGQQGYYCGLEKVRQRLRRQGITYSVQHEEEHVAIVARLT